MIALGITGGPATGKSTVTRAMQALADAMVFDADAMVHRLLNSDAGVQASVRSAFGNEVFNSSGAIDRNRLRDAVLASEHERERLEAILHPPVLSALRDAVATTRHGRACNLFLADVPLLFETGADRHLDAVVVAACSANTQLRRLIEQRQLDPVTAGRFIAAQWPLERKIERANHVIWTGGPTQSVLDQISELLQALKVPVSQTHD